ncbi:Protein held out wings [Ooceraea biroi]|uniref:Protein held out wings n=1 Tax=Ooceraea biroi TaxID=2015173 RepID=A0A026VRY7_OOCBI|nr:Protein held out wings [Ooceraea biroi]
MCDNTNTTTQSIADYLSQLLKDRKQLAAFPNVFIHVERLLDEGECDFDLSLYHLARVFSSRLPISDHACSSRST